MCVYVCVCVCVCVCVYMCAKLGERVFFFFFLAMYDEIQELSI